MHRFHACLNWSDLPHLAEQARWLVEAGVDGLHLDVIETPHLPTLTRAPALVQALRHQTLRSVGTAQHVSPDIELHLTGLPDPALARACVQAGADAITFPADSAHFAVPIWRVLRREGCRAGLALHPASSLDTLCGALGSIDQVLMVLSPPDHSPRRGWLERALARIEVVRKLVDSAGGGLRLQAEGPLLAGDVSNLTSAGIDDFVVRHRFTDPSDARTVCAQMRAQRDGPAASSR